MSHLGSRGAFRGQRRPADRKSGPGNVTLASRHHPPVFHALVALILAAPLPLGAYADWAWASLAAICGLLVLCWGVSMLAGRKVMENPPPFVLWSASALGLAMLWALLQTTGFMPEVWHHPLWRDTAEALGTPYSGAISLDPAASRESILRMASYAGVFWLAFQYGCDPGRARYALRALAVGSGCYALYGLAVTFSGAELIPWFEKTVFPDVVTATFVNPNSFATYAGIGLLCATAVLRYAFERAAPGLEGWRLRLHFILAEFMPRNALFLAIWLVLASALLLSLSRGGAAATALALLVFFWTLAARRGVRVRTLVIGLTGPVLVGAALFLVIGEGLERRLWETGSDWPKRSGIYSQTVNAIGEAPLRGTGLGTFGSVYRSHRTEEIRPGVLMAHNDYLELALELGVPAAVLFVFGFVVLAVGCARGVRARRGHAVLPAAGVAVCALVGAHSLVDFSMQIPAVAATFSLVLGVSVAQARRPGTVGTNRRGDYLAETAQSSR